MSTLINICCIRGPDIRNICLCLHHPQPRLPLQASSWASWAWASPSCSAPASAGRATVTGRRRLRGRHGDAPSRKVSLPYISSPSLEAEHSWMRRIPAGSLGTARTTSHHSTAPSATGLRLPTTTWVKTHQSYRNWPIFRNFRDNLCRFLTAGIQTWRSAPCLHGRQPCCASHHTPASHRPGSPTNTVAAIMGDITQHPCCPHTPALALGLFFFPSLFEWQQTQHVEQVCRGHMFTASSASFRVLNVFLEPPKTYPGNKSIFPSHVKRRSVHVIFVHLLNTLKKFRMSTKEMKTLKRAVSLKPHSCFFCTIDAHVYI